MAEADLRTAVLIAGGGPVGLTLAIELGRRGVACVLLNDSPETARHPKANAIGARTMEHLRRLGVAERVRRAGLADDHPTDVAYFTRLTGRELARLHMPSRADALREAREGSGPWATAEPPHRCSQIYLERCLKERAAELPAVDLRFGWRLTGFHEESDRVIGVAEEKATGKRINIEARFLAGCDGARSIVRAGLGIEYAGESGVVRPFMGGSMFAAYFRAKPDRSWLSVGRSWQYWIVNADLRAVLIHVDDNSEFLVLVGMPKGGNAQSVDIRELMRRAAAAHVPLEAISSVPWTAGYALVTQSYGTDRIFLAGDSAHLFTPTGGLGMNTGVDDAVNLGWKLAALCAGWGGPRLGASYEFERRPIGIRNVDFARGFATSVGTVPVTEEIERDSAAGGAEREALGRRLRDHAWREFIIPGIQLGLHYDSSPCIVPDETPPPPDDPNRYVPNARPGGRAPHLWLAPAVALHDRLGPEFTLLRLGRGPVTDVSEISAAAAGRRVPLAILDLPGAEARDLYAADLVLVRPDQHVAWRGDKLPADSLGLIDRVRGA